ncbi:MAG TPA: hypothetical protein VMW50_00590 [Dehalococcoidia bacterium]|nr:hypothetical protein [Dehalococcoidia bacterium]
MAVKEFSINALQSLLVSLAAVIPILWFVGKPIITEALAEDIKEIAKEQAMPLKNSFSVLLTRDINALRKEMAALRFRQAQNTDWTVEDASYLADLEIELEALREAKEALKASVE